MYSQIVLLKYRVRCIVAHNLKLQYINKKNYIVLSILYEGTIRLK